MLRSLLRHLLGGTAAVRQQHSESFPWGNPGQIRRRKRRKKARAYVLQSGVRMIDMDDPCGSSDAALGSFDNKIPSHAAPRSWIELITAYAHKGHSSEAFWAFEKLLQAGSRPDEALFLVLLAACKDLEQGKLVHRVIREVAGMQSRLTIGAALVSMYGNCGSLECSKRTFEALPRKNAASCNAMMLVLINHGRLDEALRVFDESGNARLVARDFVVVLKACHKLHHVDRIHRLVAIFQLEKHPLVAAGLIESYSRCGSLDQAVASFEQAFATKSSTSRDGLTILWTKLIAAYARHGLGRRGLEALHGMQAARVWPAASTYEAALDACADAAAATEGKLIHERLLEEKLLDGTAASAGLSRAVINMYSSCGQLEQAWGVFVRVIRNAESQLQVWNSIISAMALHGSRYEALRLFQQMQQCGVKPDEYTFQSLLRACCFRGLTVAGFAFFASMRSDFLLPPSACCCAVMVELVARGSAGGLNSAEQLVTRIDELSSSSSSNVLAWLALLAACSNFVDIERLKRVAAKVFVMDPRNESAAAVLLSLYSREGRQDVVDRMKRMSTTNLDVKKARSWMELDGVVHEFGDPQGAGVDAQVAQVLAKLRHLMAREGHCDADFAWPVAVHVVQGEQDCGGDAVWLHCEKQAIAFGLVNTAQLQSLRVFKNQRLCSHCHTFLGFVSKMTQRDILVRDSSRFHHFVASSSCSCGNYW